MSTSHCWHCGGKSQIEDTRRINRQGAIERVRACVSCGMTWTTAEIDKKRLRRLIEVEKFLKRMKA